MFDLVFEKLMLHAGSMAVVATPREFSGYSSEIFDEIFLFPCFIRDNNCSQMCILSKTDDMNKCDCEGKGIFLWKEGL